MGFDIEYGRDYAALEKLLLSVDRSGDFCTYGKSFVAMPRLEIEGVGMLSFPVPEAQLLAVMETAERAPYGKGPDTIVDTSVRDCWQVGAEKIELGGPAWRKTLAGVVDAAAKGLGCPSDRVDARLYKLLIYEPGGFFSAHRDTEKEDGMIATLVISLPVAGSGGELIVRHGEREAVIDMRADEPSELAFAAFYADCAHETRPVLDGYRLSLVFNLCLRAGDSETPTQAPDYTEQVDGITHRLIQWSNDDGAADKLVWLLEHEYSEAGLSFDALKNGDVALAQVLAPATERADCELYAAIVHIEDCGDATLRGDYVHSWHWDEIDVGDMEIDEIHDSACWLAGWTGRGSSPPFGNIPLLANELLPCGALNDADPDEQWLNEASGNEGVSLERAYRHASRAGSPSAKRPSGTCSPWLGAPVWLPKPKPPREPSPSILELCPRTAPYRPR